MAKKKHRRSSGLKTVNLGVIIQGSIAGILNEVLGRPFLTRIFGSSRGGALANLIGIGIGTATVLRATKGTPLPSFVRPLIKVSAMLIGISQLPALIPQIGTTDFLAQQPTTWQ